MMVSLINLQCVPVEGALITQHQQVILRVSCPDCLLTVLLDQLIPLPILLGVCPSQNERHSNGSDTHCQTGRKASSVLRLLFCKINVAAHDTTHVTDRDKQRHTDGALRARRQVIRNPRYEACERAVQARCDWKEETVGETWVLGVRNSKLRDEAYDGDTVAADDPGGAFLRQVGAPGPDDSDDSGEDVDGNCQKLGVGARVPETVDDGRDCGSETVDVSLCAVSCGIELTYP